MPHGEPYVQDLAKGQLSNANTANKLKLKNENNLHNLNYMY